MTFNSTEELKKYILTNSQVAVDLAKERVAFIINHFLTTYYKEFEPAVYVRTHQLLNSLVKTGVKFTGNGWEAEVYFDLNKLNHSIKTLQNANTGKTYEYPNSGWSEEAILHEAMVGSTHGGYVNPQGGNTAIWDESMQRLNSEAIDILKSSLIDAGIPVK